MTREKRFFRRVGCENCRLGSHAASHLQPYNKVARKMSHLIAHLIARDTQIMNGKMKLKYGRQFYSVFHVGFGTKHKYTCGRSHQQHHRRCRSSQPIKQPCKKTNTSQKYKQFIIVSCWFLRYNFCSFSEVDFRDCGQKRNKRKIKCEGKQKEEWVREMEIVGKREECTQNDVERNARLRSSR